MGIASFLEVVRIVRRNVPHFEEPVRPLLMLCDKEYHDEPGFDEAFYEQLRQETLEWGESFFGGLEEMQSDTDGEDLGEVGWRPGNASTKLSTSSLAALSARSTRASRPSRSSERPAAILWQP